jgi:hypothetical protein
VRSLRSPDRQLRCRPLPAALGFFLKLRSHHWAAVFLAICLLVLFAPSIGDLRWAGLVGFIYVGLPWYILAVRDDVEAKVNEESPYMRTARISPTLVVFGLLAMSIGVATDLLALHQFYEKPGVTSGLGLAGRLLFGVPFFGLGLYFLYLGLGRKPDET